MKTIDIDALGSAVGGMKWDDFRRSPNVEDRTGLSQADSLRAPTRPAEPFPPLVRRRGDLSNQAGLDDMPWVLP